MRLGVESTISPPGARCRGQLADEGGLVGDVFEHFHRGDEVERAEPQRGELARGGNRSPARRPRHAPGRRRCSRPPHRPRSPRRRAGRAVRTAAPRRSRHRARACRPAASRARGIAAPMRVDRLAHEAEPHRVEPVEHRRRALRVPPVRAPARRNARPPRAGWLPLLQLHRASRVPNSARSFTSQQEQVALGPHRDEIRRHLDGRDRAHPPRRQYRAQAAGGRARSRGGGQRDGRRDRPAGQLLPRGQPALRSGRIRRRRRLAASRSPAGCSRSPCRRWAARRAAGSAGRLPVHTDDAHAKARIDGDRCRRADRRDGRRARSR